MTCRLYLSSLFGLGVVCRGSVNLRIPSGRALSAVTVLSAVFQISQRVTSPLAGPSQMRLMIAMVPEMTATTLSKTA